MKSSDSYRSGRAGSGEGMKAGGGEATRGASGGGAVAHPPAAASAIAAIRATAIGRALTPSRVLGETDELVDLHLFLLALDPDRAQGARLHLILDPLPGALADEDLAGFGVRFEA
jgi:hypothetical protein